jgi:sporulation-control protein spo0M
MVFKKLLGAFGVGGPSVDTVLSNPNTRPGLTLEGQVHIIGGDHDVEIEQVALGLVTRVEVESGDANYDATVEFHRLAVAGRFALKKGERKEIPFQFPVPWETPVTDVYGQRLHGMTMGLRTELAVARAVDKGDLDPVHVHPLPAQERILDAFTGLGFRFKSADLERGRIRGLNQTLPFYQEIEFWPAQQYAGRINEVELTFVADAQGVDVVLEFDKRGGGPDRLGRGRRRLGAAGDRAVLQLPRVARPRRRPRQGTRPGYRRRRCHRRRRGGPPGRHGAGRSHGRHVRRRRRRLRRLRRRVAPLGAAPSLRRSRANARGWISFPRAFALDPCDCP